MGSAETHLARLHAVTAALSDAVTCQQVLGMIVELGRAAANARGAYVSLLDEAREHLELAGVAGIDRKLLAGWERVSRDDAVPIAEAVRLRAPVFLESAEQWRGRFRADLLGRVEAGGRHRAWAALPLLADGKAIGGIELSFDGAAPVTGEQERAFLMALARQFAQALERARLFEAERAAVREREQAVALLDTLLGSAPVGLAFFDGELRVGRLNPAFAEVTELPPQEHVGRRLGDLRLGVAEQIEGALRQVLETGKPVLNVELGAQGPVTGGHRDYLASYYPVRASGGEMLGVGAVVTDITSRKYAEEELKAAKEQAEAASAAKDHFLAVLSHELRTPLTPVLGAVGMWEKCEQVPAECREGLGVIRRNVELEARLIDDLLDLTRVSRGKLELNVETVDAHELVGQAVEICREQLAGKGLAVEVELKAARAHVRADGARLQQVLWNLINNAVKFTPGGGRITIATRNGEGAAFVGSARADRLFIEHAGRQRSAEANPASRDGPLLVIEVTDSGVGIEPELLPRIFNAFEQGEHAAQRRYGGLGLGLAITKALVDAHGGRLSARSAGRNRGSTFSLELETVDAPVADAHPGDEERPPALGLERSLKILLVEDHEDTSRIMSMLLRGLGHGVKTAPNMAAALEASAAESFDLVISDIGLPDGSGIELMRQLKQRHAELRGIALSGFGMEDDVARSKQAGFVEHITKPVNFQRLEGVIRQVASVARGSGA
jgi:signal transduction histidine kinase/CheY-like chemotaxis protein